MSVCLSVCLPLPLLGDSGVGIGGLLDIGDGIGDLLVDGESRVGVPGDLPPLEGDQRPLEGDRLPLL